MKILACTDIHNSKKALARIRALCRKRNPDVVVCCGDISFFEMNLEKVIGGLAGLKKPVIMVHGNHEDDAHMAKLCRKFKNIHFLHGRHSVFKSEDEEALFLGYGGDGFSLVDPIFLSFARKFEKIIKGHKGKRIVLVTHAPPHRTRLDRLPGGHCGNKSIRGFIEKHQPALALSGHIHENFGKQDRIRKTVVMNPGPLGKIVMLD